MQAVRAGTIPGGGVLGTSIHLSLCFLTVDTMAKQGPAAHHAFPDSRLYPKTVAHTNPSFLKWHLSEQQQQQNS